MTHKEIGQKTGRVFAVYHGAPLDVTRLHRPNTSWRFTDAEGHEHRWHANGLPADSYSPTQSYDVPTVVQVVDSPATEDYPAIVHHECRQCRARVTPGYCADDTVQRIPGLRLCSIDGVDVTPEEFEKAWREEQP